VEEAHQLGKKFYVSSNLAPHNSKVRSYIKNMVPVIDMNPDALIMSDPGLIMMVRERWPEVEIHLSVQANAVNFATVKFWQDYGLKRVILSRELSLKEIEEIQQECSDMELEVFVHGALCIAYSGRCLLSGYMNHRDSNQGNCTNSCRWLYQVNEAKPTTEGDYQLLNPPTPDPSATNSGGQRNAPSDKVVDEVDIDALARDGGDSVGDRVFLLEEPNRPGEYMPAFEDEHGTYIMNSKDLRAVQHVKELTEMGIASVKIEGRTKSSFYVARTAQVYRKAIDNAVAGKELDMTLMDELDSLSNRGYTEGVYKRALIKSMQNYEEGISTSQQQQFVGQAIGHTKDYLKVDVKNKFLKSDEIELMTPRGNFKFVLEVMFDDHEVPVDAAPGSGHIRRIPFEQNGLGEIAKELTDHDLKFALLMKSVDRDPRQQLVSIEAASTTK